MIPVFSTQPPNSSDLRMFSFVVGPGVVLPIVENPVPPPVWKNARFTSDPRVVALDTSVLNAHSCVEVLKVSPHTRPTIESVLHQLEFAPVHTGPAAFHWIIADTKNSATRALKHVSVNLIGNDFEAITTPQDGGSKRVRWHDNILNVRVNRFDIDPNNPLSITRAPVEITLAPNGLITVNQRGDRSHLLKLRDDISAGHTGPEVYSCIGALAAKVIQDQLENNEQILDKLEAEVDKLSQLSFIGPLSKENSHDRLPKLEETIAYFRRKMEQVEEVLSALEHSGSINPHFYGPGGSYECLRGAREALSRLLRHTSTVLEKVNRVEERHDRQMQGRVDKNVERFTILIGLTAPPILADIVCKMLLPEQHELHGPVALASLVVGGALVAIATVPNWLRTRESKKSERMQHLQEAQARLPLFLP